MACFEYAKPLKQEKAGVADHVWSIEEIVGLLDFAGKTSN
jgi:hypothetical protein